MQHWHDVGQLGGYSIAEFQGHADSILRLEGLSGSLARLFLCEPGRGRWGLTQRDLPRMVMEALAMQLEPQSGFMLAPQGLQPAQFGGHPQIQEAIESGRVKFLVGTRPDGIRTVAILLLGKSPAQQKASKPWWKFW